MALSGDEADLVRCSFRIVAQDSGRAGARFYEILFEEAPETRDLFVNDMRQQAVEFMSKLGLIVSELQNFESLRPILEDLALRHVAYGVRPEHYALVGEALLDTIAEFVGDSFTPEARVAWDKAYNDLASAMIRSAYSHCDATR